MTDHHNEEPTTSPPSTPADAQPSDDPNAPPPAEQPADPPASPDPPPPPPPADPIEALKKKLAQKKAQAGDLSAEAKHLEGDIAMLEAAQGDRDRILAAYGKAVGGLSDQRTDHSQYYDRTNQGVLGSLAPGRVDALNDAISRVVDAITRAQDTETAAETTQAAAKHAFEDANSEHDTAQSDWQSVKDYQKNLEADLKALNDLRQVIETQDSENNLDRMFYWLTVLNDRLPDTVKALTDLMTDAYQAFETLVSRKADLREKTAALREADAAVATATATLEALKTSREADILAAIDKLA